MSKSDVPYAILTAFFGLVIFIAGRWSAPDVPVTHAPAPVAAPSILVIATTAAPPPMALLPEVPEAPEVQEAPTAVASVTTYTAPKKATPAASSHKSAETAPSRTAPEPVFLEETPVLPDNPYTTPSTKSFR